MKRRIDGFYWVRIGDVWTVCQYENDLTDGTTKWWWPGWEVPCRESEFDEIDERPVVRNV